MNWSAGPLRCGATANTIVVNNAAEQAVRLVEDVQDDPARRLELASAFYADRPHRPKIQEYRRAELSFMDWQVRRGVLKPVTGEQPGSNWWRAINARLLCDSWEANRLAAGAQGPASRRAVTRWLEFLDAPTPQSWYRAHNSSVVSAYIEYRELSDVELPTEKFFMDVTLGRVLFIHRISMDPRSALGPIFWPLGRFLADPRSGSVDAYLSMRNILPDTYPLAGQSITEILDSENFAGRLVDYGVLRPRLQSLYEYAAKDLDEPQLLDFIDNGNPIYAWPYEHRDAWDPRRFRRLTALVALIAASK